MGIGFSSHTFVEMTVGLTLGKSLYLYLFWFNEYPPWIHHIYEAILFSSSPFLDFIFSFDSISFIFYANLSVAQIRA